MASTGDCNVSRPAVERENVETGSAEIPFSVASLTLNNLFATNNTTIFCFFDTA